jgi:hypothetical protein
MKNNITELVFIIDRSGSMTGFEADTVGGFKMIVPFWNACVHREVSQSLFRIFHYG